MNKKSSRLRRAKRARSKIKQLAVHRLSVHRTPRNIYAQVIAPDGSRVIANASSLDKEVRGDIENGGNIAAATVVGAALAKRALTSGIERVAFDRSGFKYHGRIKALAEAARENGLAF